MDGRLSMGAAPMHLERLRDFIAFEAQLLDAQRFDEWLALFTPEAWYWLPAVAGATDPQRDPAHLYDDAVLRRIRIERLRSPQAHSQQPPGRSHHLLQTPRLLAADDVAASWALRTNFVYTELRAGHTVTLPGAAEHRLTLVGGELRIAFKRVDLLHAAEPLPAIEFYL
jgi:3-phenylpropionate/cinnamic acid dioxygenase small subunit